MLKWVMTEMMRIEAEAKVGAVKGKHAKDRTTYFSGARARIVYPAQLQPGILIVANH